MPTPAGSSEKPLAPIEVAARATTVRWRILALLFFATTINYLDRTILTVLAPVLQYKVFHWTDAGYARITMTFQGAYAIGLLTMGAVIDKLGTRLGYLVSILTWSCFGLLHAAVRPAFGVAGFMFARFGLGFGEAGNYPAAVKTVAEWFPKKERALATGIFNAGSNVGSILAPILVSAIVSSVDGAHWPLAFLCSGIFSVIWVVAWLGYYHPPEKHPAVNRSELAHIASGQVVAFDPKEKSKWRKVLPLRETWAFAAAKCTDAAWWFYSFWAGKFFFDQFGLDLKTLALPLIIIYVAANFGSVLGGWFSSHLLKRGWSVNRARKTTLFLCAVCALPVAFSTRVGTHFVVTEGTVAVLRGVRPNTEQTTPIEAYRGKSYTSARDFLAAMRQAVGNEEVNRLERQLIEAARSDSYYWIAVALMALAVSSHQAWSTTIFTMVSDLFPRHATASVAGIGGMVGASVGIGANYLLGNALMGSGAAGYFYMLLAAGSCYSLALAAIHLLSPRLEQVPAERLI